MILRPCDIKANELWYVNLKTTLRKIIKTANKKINVRTYRLIFGRMQQEVLVSLKITNLKSIKGLGH